MIGPIRVLYLINGLGAGGTERQLVYLLNSLNREQIEPIVITIYNEKKIPYHYGTELNNLNIPIYSLNHTAGKLGRVKAIIRYIYFLWRFHPHIVQGCLHYANLIARVSRPFYLSHKLITSARAPYLQGEIRSEAYTYWLDTCLTVNSPHIYDQVIKNTHRPAHTIEVIKNGIPLEKFTENNLPTLRHQLFPDATCVIGVVGRISIEKDHLTLIEALHICRNIWPSKLAVFFLGEIGKPELLHKINQKIKEYGLQNTIRILEKTADVTPYYHASDFIVLPSRYEGFPNVVLESFAAGKPIIISDEANRAGIVQDEITGWEFAMGDAAALAVSLKAAWQKSNQERAKMGIAARQVAQNYSISKMVQQYENLYRRLILQIS